MRRKEKPRWGFDADAGLKGAYGAGGSPRWLTRKQLRIESWAVFFV